MCDISVVSDSPFGLQEGHTAHATSDEALECSHEMLNIYADAARDLLGVCHQAESELLLVKR